MVIIEKVFPVLVYMTPSFPFFPPTSSGSLTLFSLLFPFTHAFPLLSLTTAFSILPFTPHTYFFLPFLPLKYSLAFPLLPLTHSLLPFLSSSLSHTSPYFLPSSHSIPLSFFFYYPTRTNLRFLSLLYFLPTIRLHSLPLSFPCFLPLTLTNIPTLTLTPRQVTHHHDSRSASPGITQICRGGQVGVASLRVYLLPQSPASLALAAATPRASAGRDGRGVAKKGRVWGG